MKVMLVEELAERERPALRMLAYFLEGAGHTVRHSSTWTMEADEHAFRPDVVVDNLSDSSAHFLGKWAFLRPEQRNVNLVWEQVINPLSLFRFRFDEALSTRYVDGRVGWGEAFRDILVRENPGMDATRVRACGSIKHALGRLYRRVPKEELLALYPPEFRRWEQRVLLIDSFPAANMSTVEHRARRAGERWMPYFFEAIEYIRDMKELALPYFEALARAHPDRLFIFRIHPTKSDEYRQRMGAFFELPNVVTNSGGDIGPLLQLCDLVLAGRSGVLVDAFMADTPALNLTLPGHPFRSAGVAQTMEEGFAASIPLGEEAPLDLDTLLRLAAERPDSAKESARRWIHTAEPDAFKNVIAFLEETLQRPGLPKRPDLKDLRDREKLRRLVRYGARRAGLGRQTANGAVSYDYERNLALLRNALLSEERP